MRRANQRITRMVACLACVVSMIPGMTLAGIAAAKADVVGGFGLPEQWSSSYFLAQVTVVAADVDADHDDDLISFNTYSLGNRVMESSGSAYLAPRNWGNGYFMDTGFWGPANLAGDVDGDGRHDAIVGRLRDPRGIWVGRSEINRGGVGHFASATRWLDNHIVGDLGTLATDLDGDGDTDVVGLYDFVILAALSNGTAYGPLTAWGPPVLGSKATLAADVNADGSSDLIAVDSVGVRVVPAKPRWHEPAEQWSTESFSGSRKTLTGDVDADGDADLIAVDEAGVRIMRSTGTGFATPEQWYAEPFHGTKETLTGDVDGDGDADLIAVNTNDTWVLRAQ
jgi:FG-GAP-like repeat